MMLKEIVWPESGKTCLLAVSGGIDSMVMLHAFHEASWPIGVAHCNYQLRGEASNREETLVKAYCEQNQIPFYSHAFDTAKIAEQNQESIQVAARNLRYAYFSEIQKLHGFKQILTAHHRNDQIETLLFHLIRGTGLQGLSGIPEKNGSIFRPLLQVSKSDILAYAKHYQVPYLEDGSNLQTDYTRNKIRHLIIPRILEHFPSFEENMLKNIQRFKETLEIYQQSIHHIRETLVEKRGKDLYIPIRKLLKAGPLRTIVFELFYPYGFSANQTTEIIKLLDARSGAAIEQGLFRIIRHRDFLVLTATQTTESEIILLESDFGTLDTPLGKLTATTKPAAQFEKPSNPWTCCIDRQKLQFPLILRKWKQGDYLYPLGMEKKKKVARILIDAKVPLHEKEQIWIVESNQKIIWIPGFKTDHRFRITDKSETLFQLSIKPH